MNRIKRISTELMQRYPNKFGLEFDTNKSAIKDLVIFRSKVLRNEVAGYITAHLRKEAAHEKATIKGEVEENEE
jgi:small subunit ribosomal protein S17e